MLNTKNNSNHGCTDGFETSILQKSLHENLTQEQARQAILKMAGEYKVDFRFEELYALKAGYKLKENDLSEGHETVIVLENTANKVSLQHILIGAWIEDNLYICPETRKQTTMENKTELILIRISGVDRPGLTASVTAILSKYPASMRPRCTGLAPIQRGELSEAVTSQDAVVGGFRAASFTTYSSLGSTPSTSARRAMNLGEGAASPLPSGSPCPG